MKLQEKTAIVTGAGQGIGRAIALLSSREGARVAIVERNHETGTETLNLLEQAGGQGLFLAADVADPLAIRETVKEVLRKWGHIDILINNAGFDRPAGIFKIKEEDWDAVLGVHLRAAMLLIREVLPGMRERNTGRIVNISSIYGKVGGKGEIAYATAKAGLLGLTKSVAREVGRFGVCVNAVLPGLTDTPTIRAMMADTYRQEILSQTPLGRLAQPEEIARAAVFLASDEASYITGAGLEVSGGWEM